MQGLRIKYLPRRLEEDGVSLVIPGPFGILKLCQMMRDMDGELRQRLGLNRSFGILWAFFMVSKIFKWVYLIKKEEKAVGMLGAYQWEPGISSVLSMVIWHNTERGQGTGSKALKLALKEFSKRGLCKEFFVEVSRDNLRGMRFWKRQGFREIGCKNQTVVLGFATR